jgi:bifunctional N-acetylglucosamine-1-phosphate-uridyltransferase/glucosamine-1-phosphate-acetyltransferase GlmU-like protein
MYSISKKDFLHNLKNSEDTFKTIMGTVFEAPSKYGRKVMKLNNAIEIIRKKEIRREKLE